MGPLDQSAAASPLVEPRTVTRPAGGAGRGEIRVFSVAGVSIVTTPAEVGSENAQEFWEALAAASASHAVTIADMTATLACSLDAVTALLMALRRADASGGELWLAVSPVVGSLLSATAFRGCLPTFGRLSDATAALRIRRPDVL